jgi:hypothetical protein
VAALFVITVSDLISSSVHKGMLESLAATSRSSHSSETGVTGTRDANGLLGGSLRNTEAELIGSVPCSHIETGQDGLHAL